MPLGSDNSIKEKANKGRENLQEMWDTFNKIKKIPEFQQAIVMIKRTYEKPYLNIKLTPSLHAYSPNYTCLAENFECMKILEKYEEVKQLDNVEAVAMRICETMFLNKNTCLRSVVVHVQLMTLKFSGESPLYNCTELSCFRDDSKGRIKDLIESGVNFLSLEDINADIEHFRMALNDDINHVLDRM